MFSFWAAAILCETIGHAPSFQRRCFLFLPTDRLFGDNGTHHTGLKTYIWKRYLPSKTPRESNPEKGSSRYATILWQRGKTNTFEENIFYHPALHCSDCDVLMWWTAGRDWSNIATDPSSRLQFLVRCAAWFLIHCQRTQSILFRWHSSSIYWTLNAFSFLQPLLNLMIWGHIAHQVFKRIT